jgi:hypothetical protein
MTLMELIVHMNGREFRASSGNIGTLFVGAAHAESGNARLAASISWEHPSIPQDQKEAGAWYEALAVDLTGKPVTMHHAGTENNPERRQAAQRYFIATGRPGNPSAN